MRTSDPAIWAVGDAVEVTDYVTGQPALVPLAGPARGRDASRRIISAGATRGFAACRARRSAGFLTWRWPCTGASEKTLRRIGETDFEKIYLHPP